MLYDRRRHEDAIAQWETSVQRNPDFATAWRNLGIAYFNVRADEPAALNAFDHAHAIDPSDGRILYERDQLWKRVGKSPEVRLAELQSYSALACLRHDLTVEIATLLNQIGKSEQALQLLTGRIFQPWEGGEGLVLAQLCAPIYSRDNGLSSAKDPNPRAAFLRGNSFAAEKPW